jgi:hypothetical protein
MTEAKHDDGSDLTGLERLRDNVADTMDSTSRTIAEQARADGGEDAEGVNWSLKAAEWLEAWSDELREWDPRDTDANVRAFIASRSGRMLLLAGAVGIVLGGVLRRR